MPLVKQLYNDIVKADEEFPAIINAEANGDRIEIGLCFSDLKEDLIPFD